MESYGTGCSCLLKWLVPDQIVLVITLKMNFSLDLPFWNLMCAMNSWLGSYPEKFRSWILWSVSQEIIFKFPSWLYHCIQWVNLMTLNSASFSCIKNSWHCLPSLVLFSFFGFSLYCTENGCVYAVYIFLTISNFNIPKR